jgi:hypothetical protein
MADFAVKTEGRRGASGKKQTTDRKFAWIIHLGRLQEGDHPYDENVSDRIRI